MSWGKAKTYNKQIGTKIVVKKLFCRYLDSFLLFFIGFILIFNWIKSK